jgi:hypothetical protein
MRLEIKGHYQECEVKEMLNFKQKFKDFDGCFESSIDNASFDRGFEKRVVVFSQIVR